MRLSIERRRSPRNWLKAWTRTVRWEDPYSTACTITYVRSPAGTNVIWFVNDSRYGQLIGVTGWEIFNDNPINGPILVVSSTYGGSKVASGTPNDTRRGAVPGSFFLASVAVVLTPQLYSSPGNVAFSARWDTPRLVIPPTWALGLEWGVFSGTGQLTYHYLVVDGA